MRLFLGTRLNATISTQKWNAFKSKMRPDAFAHWNASKRVLNDKKQNVFVFEMRLNAAACGNASKCISETRLDAFNHHFATQPHLDAPINAFRCVRLRFSFTWAIEYQLISCLFNSWKYESFSDPLNIQFIIHTSIKSHFDRRWKL